MAGRTLDRGLLHGWRLFLVPAGSDRGSDQSVRSCRCNSRPHLDPHAPQSPNHLDSSQPSIHVEIPVSRQPSRALEFWHGTPPSALALDPAELFSGQFTHDHVTSGIEAKAHRKVFKPRVVYDRALEDVEVLVTPCVPSVMMPLPSQTSCSSSSSNDKLENADSTTVLKRLESTIGVTSNTCPFNVTGHLARSVP